MKEIGIGLLVPIAFLIGYIVGVILGPFWAFGLLLGSVLIYDKTINK